MKILIVDDDLISRMALIDVIQGFGGYRLVEAASGDEAWALINGSGVPPMLVCCDIRMPGMSGLELLRRVRAEPAIKDLPFVLISMANDEATIRDAIQIGVSGYIVKPFSQQDAHDRLGKVLALALSRVMERPCDTMTRLKIAPDRYHAYLGSLQRQVSQLIAEIGAVAHPEALTPVRLKMASLQAGCAPLGLWRAASLLKRYSAEDASSADMTECLDEIQQHLHKQLFAAE
jgi:two-component system chemotaxis response regulator CheY